MITTRLAVDVPTPLGAYGPGTQVYPVRKVGGRVVVCVDPVHLSHRCHTVTVPVSALHVTKRVGS